MRRALVALALALPLLADCTDWTRFSRDFEGPEVCATFVVLGDVHSCVRKANGSLYCWGDNRFGQLGTGDMSKRSVPTKVDGATSKIYVPAGNGDITVDLTAFTCALRSDGGFYCWGDNRFGQLGVGNTTPSASPVPIPELNGRVSKATNGGGHTCVQATDGSLLCWGRNVQGQLGTGDTKQQASPVTVDIGRPIERLSAGGEFTCARGTDARLFCWGSNTAGQLGIGSTDSQLKPAEVKTLGTRVGRLTTGGKHACVFTEDDGHVWCWGDNRAGQLGTGDLDKRLVPVEIDPKGLGAVRTNQLFGGGSHTCALRDDNTLWCWGGNRFGQLGTGDAEPRLTPTQIMTDVASAYAGGAHTCAIKTDGSLLCWGNNQYGQLGVDVGPQSLSAVQVLPACQ